MNLLGKLSAESWGWVYSSEQTRTRGVCMVVSGGHGLMITSAEPVVKSELNMAKEMDKRSKAMSRNQEDSPLNTITEELETAKQELASIKGEGFNFMASMDVIREELKHVREETTRLEKVEQTRELTVQNLNSKILRAKAKLEALSAVEMKNIIVASNLIITLKQFKSRKREIEEGKRRCG
ncbi:hypothetical protein LXL04_036364 [Taraxacum kok-saghyz]